jgi:DNA polymerase-3 subunit beta
MQFTVLQENFQKGLSVVSRAVNQRSPLPVLSNLLIKTDKGRIKVTASDLQITISSWIGAKVDVPGEITVPAKILIDFVNQLSDEKIEMTLDGANLKVITEKAKANFATIPASEFPNLELPEDGNKLSVKSSEILKAIQQVQFASATDESRPVLTGIYLRAEKDVLVIACTDGYRMAEYKLKLAKEVESAVKCVIPARAFADIIKSFVTKSEEIEITINTEKNAVVVRAEDSEAQLRMIEGQYPDYESVLPKEFTTEIRVSKTEILNAIKLASVFAKDIGNSVKISASGESIEAKSQPSETGSDLSKINGELTGDNIEITFNAKYLLDFLNSIDESEIIFKASDSLKPGLFNIVGQDNYFFLAMPMKANW